jgi:hypothetical protein
MLQVLREEAERQGLRNIRCVNKFWRDVAVGKEVDEEFDVVVASNSMNLLGAKENGTRRKQLDWDLEDAVEKINRLGARNHATMPLLEHSTADVYEQLGREYYGFPDHIIVHNVLAQMGLSVGVSYLMVQDNMVHQSRLLSDRVSWTLNLDDKDKARVEDIVQNRIKVSDSNLQLWSLIQWTAARPD